MRVRVPSRVRLQIYSSLRAECFVHYRIFASHLRACASHSLQSAVSLLKSNHKHKLEWPSWSKAADLSSVIFGCAGSNPASSTQILFVSCIFESLGMLVPQYAICSSWIYHTEHTEKALESATFTRVCVEFASNCRTAQQHISHSVKSDLIAQIGRARVCSL